MADFETSELELIRSTVKDDVWISWFKFMAMIKVFNPFTTSVAYMCHKKQWRTVVCKSKGTATTSKGILCCL